MSLDLPRRVTRTHGRSAPERPTPEAEDLPPKLWMVAIDREARLCWVSPDPADFSEDRLGPFDADAFEVAWPDRDEGKAA